MHINHARRSLISRTIFILVLILGTSCDNQTTFDSEKWKIEEDLRTYPFREKMVDDIIQNKKFIGLNFSQILDSLGQPTLLENMQIFYLVKTDYGTDIDPVYSRDLVLTINKDSVVTGVSIKEWKK